MKHFHQSILSLSFVLAVVGCAQEADQGERESVENASTVVSVGTDQPDIALSRSAACRCRPGECGINVTLPDGNQTTEAGNQVRLLVSLTSRPIGRVTVTPTSTAATEGVPSQAVSFHPWDWNRPQVIVVTGQPDQIHDGKQPYRIQLKVVAPADCCYGKFSVSDVDLVNEDDDEANLVFLALTPLNTTEHGGEARVNISLNSQPTSDVQVSLSVTDDTEAIVSPTTIQFTPQNWGTPQPIAVKGLSDLLLDGSVSYNLEASVVSADPVYASLVPEVLTLQNLDGSAFAGIGDLPGGENQSAAFDVNADGTVLVGHSANDAGRVAIRWTAETGLVSLGGTNSAAWGISSSGEVIAGESLNSDSRLIASRWIGGQGPELLTSFRSNSNSGMAAPSRAVGVSGDGNWVVGSVSPTGGMNMYGAAWRRGQVEDSGGGGSEITAANEDGSILVGYQLSRRAVPFEYAMRAGERLPYPFPVSACMTPLDCRAKAFDVSLDGAVTVGSAYTERAAQNAAVAWMVDEFGTLTTVTLSSQQQAAALSVSGNGVVIVGYDQYSDGVAAARWTNGASQKIEDLLAAAGLDMTGWTLTSAHGASNDGRVMVGEGVNPDGAPEGWIAVLP